MMFGKTASTVIIDLLFIMLLSFVALCFISFIMIQDKKDDESAKNDNNILITMKWKMDNDMDLWLKLPDGRRIGYNDRDNPPAHLDVDVVRWRRYQDLDGKETVIELNEEIITIRDIMEGEYTVNVHYYSAGAYGQRSSESRYNNEEGNYSDQPDQEYRSDSNSSPSEVPPTEVLIMVQDVKNKRIVYHGKKEIKIPRDEVHFVKFTVEAFERAGVERYRVTKVYTDRPAYFVGKKK